jgi:hypothetical protein
MQACINVNVNPIKHPELFSILKDKEDITVLRSMTHSELLLRWFNHHLTRAKRPPLKNFGSDLQDCSNYVVLLNALAPELCSLDLLKEPVEQRAKKVIEYSSKLGVSPILSWKDIVEGDASLNKIFISVLFQKCSGWCTLSNEN